MAQNNYKFKMGSQECEWITGITFSDTNAKSITHTLGVIPDVVLVSNTTAAAAYVVAHVGTYTASVVQLTPDNASATCDLLLMATNKGSAVLTV